MSAHRYPVMRVGDLVRVKTSFSQKRIGTVAIVVDEDPWGATLRFSDGERREYDKKKLEVISESR